MASADRKANLNDLALIQQSSKPTAPDTGKAALYAYTDGRLALEFPDTTEYIFEGSTSPLTIKGDILTFSTVPTRLGIGANNSVFVADSAQTTGNKWTTALTGLSIDNSVIGGTTRAAGGFTNITLTSGGYIRPNADAAPGIIFTKADGTTIGFSIDTTINVATFTADASQTLLLIEKGSNAGVLVQQMINTAAFSTSNQIGFETRANSSTSERSLYRIIGSFSTTTDATRTTTISFVGNDAGSFTNIWQAVGRISTFSGAVNVTGSSDVSQFVITFNATQTTTPIIWQDSGGNVTLSQTNAGLTVLRSNDAATATVANVLTLNHGSSGTTAANYGTGLLFNGRRSTTNSTTMGRLRYIWTDVSASYLAKGILSVNDSLGERDAAQFLADGTGAIFEILAGLRGALRVVTAAGAVTVTNQDLTIVVNKTVGAATTVNLPAGVANQIFIIKDGKGDANTNNITVTPAAGNIDGAATYVINVNFGSAIIQYNGTQWNVLAKF